MMAKAPDSYSESVTTSIPSVSIAKNGVMIFVIIVDNKIFGVSNIVKCVNERIVKSDIIRYLPDLLALRPADKIPLIFLAEVA